MHRILALLGLFLFAACAGRAPQPVAAVQDRDRLSDCQALQSELLANNRMLADLSSESGAKVAQNIAAGVVGLVIWPVWFAMDFQNAAGRESTALEQRNQYLTTLASTRCQAQPPAAPVS